MSNLVSIVIGQLLLLLHAALSQVTGHTDVYLHQWQFLSQMFVSRGVAVPTYQIAWCHISEDYSLHTVRHENIRSCIFVLFVPASFFSVKHTFLLTLTYVTYFQPCVQLKV
jgi:purine-cytosine permease-like protein